MAQMPVMRCLSALFDDVGGWAIYLSQFQRQVRAAYRGQFTGSSNKERWQETLILSRSSGLRYSLPSIPSVKAWWLRQLVILFLSRPAKLSQTCLISCDSFCLSSFEALGEIISSVAPRAGGKGASSAGSG